MNDKQDYVILKRKFLNVINEQKRFKYTAFLRLAFSEIESLMVFFPLTEIVNYLSKDTGININYGSMWSAHKSTQKRFKKAGVKDIDKSISHPEYTDTNSINEQITPSIKKTKNQDFTWLYADKYSALRKHETLIALVKDNDLTEEDISALNLNFFNPISMVNALSECAYEKRISESSSRIFKS